METIYHTQNLLDETPPGHLKELLIQGGYTMQAIQFIDEVKDAPIDADSILTDDQLGRGGLVKIEAFVRTKTSAAASRKAKQREHQKAEGIHTVTLTVPVEAKEQLKAVAAEIASGKSLVDAVQSVTSHKKPNANNRRTCFGTNGVEADDCQSYRNPLILSNFERTHHEHDDY